MKKRPALIFWREVPIDVDVKTYEYIASAWGNDVICCCFQEIAKERKKIGFGQENYIKTLTVLGQKGIVSIIQKNKDAIHVLGGVRGNMWRVLSELKKEGETKIGVICERPTSLSSGWRRLLHEVYSKGFYGLVNCYYSRQIKFICAMGEPGVDAYRRIGCKTEKLFPYMYCSGDAGMTRKVNHLSNRVRFVYIGRFDAMYKGVDLLIKAIDDLPKDLNVSVDFVGGYGHLLKEILDLANRNTYVRFIGQWEPSAVVENLAEYDVCLVPSKYEGWNLSANHAINAGIACVITTEAGSSELIRYAGNGLLIESSSVDSIKRAILYVVEHPELLTKWKEKAVAFQYRISAQAVGNYLIEILDYTILHRRKKRPKAPWIGEEK